MVSPLDHPENFQPGPEPLVSVVMPVFNAAPFLPEAIGSILDQSYRNLEVIAINDGSTDGSLDILKRFRARDARVRIISRENRGLIETLNEGLSLASGELIARMDADDISYQGRIARQVATFGADPRLGVCGSGFDILIGSRLRRYRGDRVVLTARLPVLSMFFTVFKHSTVMFNRAVLGDSLHYDASYKHAEDFELFRRIIRDHPACMINESLIAYREHAQSVTGRHLNPMQQTHLRIVEEALEQEGFEFERGAFRRLRDELTPHSVEAAADALRKLERQVEALPPATRTSYGFGLEALFYFLYGIIRDEKKPHLQHRFMSRTGKWGMLRRRERYILRLAAKSPGLVQLGVSLIHVVDRIATALKSTPLSRRIANEAGVSSADPDKPEK